jgi:phosphosulfolactate synthase (CoM biosynthesis protein A)
MMSLRTGSGLLLFMLFFMGVSAVGFAQDESARPSEVTDEELKSFAEVVLEIQVIQDESQQEMIGAVEKEGFEVQRFIELQQAQQNPDEEIDATDEELEKYVEVGQQLDVIHRQSQQKMEKKITDSGLSINRYQEIGSIIQSDPEMQKKLQEYMQG